MSNGKRWGEDGGGGGKRERKLEGGGGNRTEASKIVSMRGRAMNIIKYKWTSGHANLNKSDIGNGGSGPEYINTCYDNKGVKQQLSCYSTLLKVLIRKLETR